MGSALNRGPRFKISGGRTSLLLQASPVPKGLLLRVAGGALVFKADADFFADFPGSKSYGIQRSPLRSKQVEVTPDRAAPPPETEGQGTHASLFGPGKAPFLEKFATQWEKEDFGAMRAHLRGYQGPPSECRIVL